MRKPLTEKQKAASRINGRKSHGPNTPRGRSVSSRNAIKHGFLAQTVLLPGESPVRFLALKNTYLHEFQPQTQPEFDLIDTLIVNRWRLLRNWTLESVNLIHKERELAQANAGEDPPTQTMMALRNLQNPPRTQEALSRHEVRLDRQYYKALDRLYRLKESREAKGVGEVDGRAICPPHRPPENEESTKRTWEIIENKTTSFAPQPGEKPHQTRELPEQNPAEPEESPSQTPRAA